MKFEFQQIWYLVLLLPVLAAVIWMGYKGRFVSKLRQKLHTAMRVLLCTLLILAMANPIYQMQSNITTTIFAVDASDSIQGQDETIQTFLQEAEAAKTEQDAIGVLSFGRHAMVEQMPQLETNAAAGRLAEVDQTATDIAGGLEMAASLLPSDTGRRVVLVSDGNETLSDSLQQAKALASQGIVVDVFGLELADTPEVQITDLEIAERINKNVRYELAVRVDSNIDTTAQVRLYREDTMIAQEDIDVRAGENRVVFSDLAEQGGHVTYRAEITPQQDTMKENNRIYGYTYITDVPQMLIIEQEDAGREWESMLSSKFQVTRVDASAAPVDTDRLAAYDGVILANVDARELPDGFDEALEVYVRTLGGGLLVSGGENAYALGGYEDTMLSDILPVKMELETQQEEGDLTMIMVIDRSGSMSEGQYGITRIEMAKEAAIRSLDNFGPNDRVGVVGFDSLAEWVAEPQSVQENKVNLTQKIGSMQIGGGTSILPALQLAFNGLQTENTKQKHILLLTDGQAEQSGYDSLLSAMRQQNITLSTIAVGGDADTKLMQRLAEAGGGRYYFTDEFTDLPEIFAKELDMANREYINNRDFYPTAQDASVMLDGVEALPMLDGYISTTAKSRAEVVLVSDLDEPILAGWQYGLGRTVAWTSDAQGQWTQGWLATEEGVAVLRNAASWIMKTQSDEEVRLSAEAGETESQLRLEMPFDAEVSHVALQVVDNANQTYEVDLMETAPGMFEGTLETAQEGAYIANVNITRKDTQSSVQTGFHISYAKEYDMTSRINGLQLLTQIAESTGGRVLTDGTMVFDAKADAAQTQKQLQIPLLIACMVLLLLDIALRRFPAPLVYLEQRAHAKAQARQQKALQPKVEKKKPQEKTQQTHPEKEQPKQPKPPKSDKQVEAAQQQSSTAQKLTAAKKRRGR